MIQIEPIPLPPAEAKRIRDWLSRKEAVLFAQILDGKAAELTAKAGNELFESRDDQNIEDAKKFASEAAAMGKLSQIIQEMRDPEYEFPTVKLTTKPTIQDAT